MSKNIFFPRFFPFLVVYINNKTQRIADFRYGKPEQEDPVKIKHI